MDGATWLRPYFRPKFFRTELNALGSDFCERILFAQFLYYRRCKRQIFNDLVELSEMTQFFVVRHQA